MLLLELSLVAEPETPDVGSSCLLPQHQAWPTARCQLLHMGFSCLSPAQLWEARGQHLS